MDDKFDSKSLCEEFARLKGFKLKLIKTPCMQCQLMSYAVRKCLGLVRKLSVVQLRCLLLIVAIWRWLPLVRSRLLRRRRRLKRRLLVQKHLGLKKLLPVSKLLRLKILVKCGNVRLMIPTI